MRLRKISQLFIISFLLLTLMSCVYLRLLAFKNQLVDFDKNFSTEVDQNFILHFKDPMLYEKDVVYLSEVEPTLKIPDAEGELWTYRFHRINEDYVATNNGPDLVFEMGFNQEEMLNKIEFAEVFLHMIPANFLERTIRALGTAEVDRKTRHVKAKIGEIDKELLDLPFKKEIISNLGEPLKVESVENNEEQLTYLYFLDGADVEQKEEALAKAILFVNKKSGKLMQVRCKFAGLKLSIDYRKWLDEKKQMATS